MNQYDPSTAAGMAYDEIREGQRQRLKSSCPSDATPCSAGWNAGTAPKDGKLYVAMGRVVWAEKYGGGSSPFLAQVKYRSVDGGQWVDQDDMAIAQTPDDVVHVDHWIYLPNEKRHPVARDGGHDAAKTP